jgi:CBS domain-containing protein/GNAT superfamily N-acetyltransferase
MYRDLVITECSSELLVAALHEAALPDLEYVFAYRTPVEGDQILVAWQRGEPVGYVASSMPDVGEVLVWEHGVVPSRRGRGVGTALIHEVAKRAPRGSILVIDPAGLLDEDRMADYYGRIGFVRRDRSNLWATATDVLQATPRVEEPAGTGEDTVGDLVRTKHSRLVTVDVGASAADAIATLAAHDVGALPVMSAEIKLVGIVSERDVVRAMHGSPGDVASLPVSQLMADDVVTCSLDDSVTSVMALMTHRRIRHLPVVEGDQVIAMVSIGDVVRRLLERSPGGAPHPDAEPAGAG